MNAHNSWPNPATKQYNLALREGMGFNPDIKDTIKIVVPESAHHYALTVNLLSDLLKAMSFHFTPVESSVVFRASGENQVTMNTILSIGEVNEEGVPPVSVVVSTTPILGGSQNEYTLQATKDGEPIVRHLLRDGSLNPIDVVGLEEGEGISHLTEHSVQCGINYLHRVGRNINRRAGYSKGDGLSALIVDTVRDNHWIRLTLTINDKYYQLSEQDRYE